ncbi:MAG TPA: thioredoxin domain-containing protein [Pyrinomonadaceae bacterium]|nr:thioredoxin domain-containing protein [Chloracidobacterium sp.]MBP9934174.1 thioredoxin domain-containing protein [Pyrinomonadaceae bacterium]MBK7801628.1 thioredoxin domain-containing protein [Chloracidobacterium sp.]MBK9436944.1 thioredoxin domain-containing protein [Chloracidobacterium sp.]MBK9768193.1 thioredoxin domain-containing protein [Chloracidobacterium sp.]
MSKQNQKKSGMPVVIIGIVLLLAVGGGYYLFTSGKPGTPPKTNTNAAANATKTPGIPVNAPLGAQPPNQAGSPTASVTVEEFADFQCGSCAAANPVMSEIKSSYGSRIRFIFRNYPLSIPAHDKSYDAAVTVEAAGMQGKFWEMQNQLFSNQQTWTSNPNYKQLWNEYAQKLGLDLVKLQADVAGIAAKGRVDADLQRGRGLNVNSTPTVYVNGISIPFNEMKVESLKRIIDAELEKAASTPPAAKPAAENTNSNK